MSTVILHRSKVVIVCGAVLATALAACGSNNGGSSSHLDTVSLRLDYTPAGHHVPFYYGKAAGFYKAEGISLNIVPGQGSADTAKVVGSGKDAFGWISLSLVPLAIQQHAPIEAVAGIIRKGGFGLLVPDKSSIHKWTDLDGKTAIIARSGTQYALFQAVMKKENIRNVHIQNAGTNSEAIYAGGKGDAVGTLTWYALPFVNPQRPSRAMDFWNAGIHVLDYGIVTKSSLVKSNPDLIRRFVAATVKSWDQARKHPDKAVGAFLKANPSVKKTVTQQQFEGALSHIDTPASKGKPLGYMASADWKAQLKVEHLYLDCKVCTSAPTKFYTNEFIPK